MKSNYDEIRCYTDSEVNQVLTRLSNEKQFVKILSTVYPLIPKELLINKLTSFHKTLDFQKEMVYPFLQYLEANLTKGIELIGINDIDKSQSYLYISNHRDIILDSALLCGKLIEMGMDTVEIAIGDNLLIFPWIEDLTRANKNFIVRRGINSRQILESSKLLSSYVHYTITEKKQSIWLAQREGRAKDSNDRTQLSLIKMLNMFGTETIPSNLKHLNICPLTISYEYDPCDYLKAKEFQQKRDNPNYKKSPNDDLINMQTGVMGYKGKVVYALGGSINKKLSIIEETTTNKNEQIEQIAQHIDQTIHSNYTIFKCNKIAYDILLKENRFNKDYSSIEKLDFEKYIALQIDKIDLEDKDYDFLFMKMMEMYANPLINYLKAKC